MAYTQAPVKRDMYMEIPKVFEVEGDGDYVLQIHKNIYSRSTRTSTAKSKQVTLGTSNW